MLYLAVLLVIPTVTSYDRTYACFCNFGTRPLAIITGSYQYRGHYSPIHGFPSPDHDPSAKLNALQNPRFVKGLLPHLLPGRCLKRHLGYNEARAEIFPVSVLGQVGYIHSNKADEMYRTRCDASTGKPIPMTTPTSQTTPKSLHANPSTDRPNPMYTTNHSISKNESYLQRKDLTCFVQLCIDCHCKFGKLTQSMMGLVGKRTICLMCNFCSIDCNATEAGTITTAHVVPAAQILTTAPVPLPPVTTPTFGPAGLGGCADSVDSCAIHSRSICTAFPDWSRQNCVKYCEMCPSFGYPKPTTGHWLSFGNS
ncbi:uncharacterized protein LOC110461104 [Mizuhopecten yessoensis]|uniref:ShKT domain-containing protein n=1 Tax=Mizuhopecten yessoensis TaxID=6573 RepID=A0A210Q113_MIZYE|nr:uncharacterized protein LOC110461104 [Mizuhopecten yessoensis]XP_021370067.1 uncharacterized protein LOC110461104 [Mizuhopecten yessoensis]OWF42417.1 hypothetical protein KP79_PYT24223 [Mizuhopecten yessoensis]